MKKQVTIAVIGAGSRGTMYARLAHLAEDGKCRVVAVAEPRDLQRRELADYCQIPPEWQFRDWRELVQLPRLADAVIVATQDHEHTGPALAFLEAGYHLLLEKPMAPTAEEYRAIVEVARKNQRIVGVSHVLRYTPYFRKLRDLLQSGLIGDLVSFRHFEGVVYWHQAKLRESSPMILAKSCHDLDILLFMTGLKCCRLNSFGALRHFIRVNQPVGAAEHCLDCPLAQTCVYSAVTYYRRHLADGNHGWPLDIITDDFTEAGLNRALREGPYGRCVYACDNDVVDHQTVNFLFDNDVSGTFISEEGRGRETEFFGTHGSIWGNTAVIKVHCFNGETYEYDMTETNGMLDGGHLGGDAGLIHDFIEALRFEDASRLTSSPEVSLTSHLMAFAAEESRLQNGPRQEIVF